MSAYYIGCDIPPTENGSAVRLQCKYSHGAIAFTEQQLIDLYVPSMTIQDAHEIGLVLMAIWLLAYTGKKTVQALWFS